MKPKVEERPKIWCLFSVDNNYDQPEHNLVCWWTEKPAIAVLAEAMGAGMVRDEEIVAVVRVWQESPNMPLVGTVYTLRTVTEGVTL